MPNPEDSSNEGLGQLYDSVPLYAKRGDMEFYVARGTESEGPVLELRCGTGRVLLPTARAGIAITGIERSGEMIDRCRLTLSAEPAECGIWWRLKAETCGISRSTRVCARHGPISCDAAPA